MTNSPASIQRIYLSLTFLNTLAASFIWGINTLFLLDAGLSNSQAFLANSFFTIGQVLFEIPTGIVADTWGRKISYILGTITLSISTLLYLWAWYVQAPFWIWVCTSLLLGLGFTFFSGATEAWLVDALKYTSYEGSLDNVFAKGQIVGGIAMFTGSITGGFIAQLTSLGVPYLIRACVLGLNFLVALFFMRDLGFTPKKSKQPLKEMKRILASSLEFGIRNPQLKWIMIAAPFTSGVSFYLFYAAQPFLLQLYGNERAYGVAGIAAAVVAGAQILGGLSVPYLSKYLDKRTTILSANVLISVIVLFSLKFITSFPVAVVFILVWALVSAAADPIRQSYINKLIPSTERATVLSFDSVISSLGAAIIQPLLGSAADLHGYATSFSFGGVVEIFAFPFIYSARKQKSTADVIEK